MDKYKNIKTGNIYTKFSRFLINATNAQDGQLMVGYFDTVGIIYVREKNEFDKKFKKV
jgi:hypothetical protein